MQSAAETSNLPVRAALKLVTEAAALLFENGQTTERLVRAAENLAASLHFRASIVPAWGDLKVCLDNGRNSYVEILNAAPQGVDIGKVAAVTDAVDDFCAGRTTVGVLQSEMRTVAAMPSVAEGRFIVMAAVGAMALGVIFGALDLLTLVLIGVSTGAGALARRWLAGVSRNPFIQPFTAAFLAGLLSAVVGRLHLYAPQSLIVVCPCMVLVPGPHLLNGALDMARARIALGLARLAYANLIILVICVGLLAGLSFSGMQLSVTAPSIPVPLIYDVVAAGVAVAAYGTFFSMPWQKLPIPILIGMLAHAARWAIVSGAGLNVAVGALAACLVASTIATPVADRMRFPFAAFAFASVVSLIPGVLLFRTAAGLVSLALLGGGTPAALLGQIFADAGTATLVFIAMAFGLIMPKMFIEHFTER